MPLPFPMPRRYPVGPSLSESEMSSEAYSGLDLQYEDDDAKKRLNPLRENYAVSRDHTSGNNSKLDIKSAVPSQTQSAVFKKPRRSPSRRRSAFGDAPAAPIEKERTRPRTVVTSRNIWNSESEHGEYLDEQLGDEGLRIRETYRISNRSSKAPQSDTRAFASEVPIEPATRMFPKRPTVTDPEVDGLDDEDDGYRYMDTDDGPQPELRDKIPSRARDSGSLSVMVHPFANNDLLEELEQLRRENERLKQQRSITPPPAAHLASTYKVFHYIEETCYLDEPQWVPGGDGRPRLRANNPIRNIEYYLDQHPEIAFAIIKTYISKAPIDQTKIETKDGVFRVPEPRTQVLSLISDSMIEAVEEFVQKVPDFDSFFPYFDPRSDIKAPYLFMYYSAPFLMDVLHDLDRTSRYLLEQLDECIQASHGFEHTSAKALADKGCVSKNMLQYLIRPGDVLIQRAGPRTKAYLASDWAKEIRDLDVNEESNDDYDVWGERTRKRGPKRGVNTYATQTYRWKVPVWSWDFDGNFSKTRTNLVVSMTASDEHEINPIDRLSIMPLRFAPSDVYESLEKRGRTFWKLRHQRFVSYRQTEDDALHSVSDRYMVDVETYKQLHPESAISLLRLPASLDRKEMESDEPPSGNALLLFPPTIPGFNLLRKMWSDLYVDQISDIVWNKQAFKDLVVDDETKELVQALVMKQIAVEKSTDVIQGKGTGLILLLHGGPGTGKTFTAEGVAEFAEKPLLRVTCGDVGTEAEVVEARLKSSFSLGKIWDCVVLLDEADVFLEERDMKDLNRNALVSVFLRELEYHDGILILTSNRVGTFDEAFKSRIQLALHYENLGSSQRRKIWRNLLNRVKTLDQPMMDFDDIMDHIDDLCQFEMNGREIRNAITTARQLAQFKEKPLCYSHVKHVVRVSGKFSKYLKDLRDGLTEDDLKRDSGLRLTYKINKGLQKECPF